MNTAFSTALSSLNATSTAINIVGNNLANLNTAGYKAVTVQFSDLMSQELGASSNASEVGLGVGPAQAVRQFTQGSIQQTTGGLDAAIQGDGFFVVKNQNNDQLYTRAGNFSLDATGHLLTANGDKVQGWSATNGVVDANSAVGDVVVPVNGVLPAVATTNMSATVNLNAAATVGAAGASYSCPIQVVDSLGNTHTLTANFTKTDSNKWAYDITIPNADLATPGTAPASPFPASPNSSELFNGTLTFDGTGVLTSPAATDAPTAVAITGLADGAKDMSVNWNLFNNGTGVVTQFAQANGVSATTQDGVTAGQITDVGISDGGLLVAHYSNGQQTTVGQIALASIENPGSLLAVGNNELQASTMTSEAAIGAANSGGRGQILGSSLEASTVDIATEFTNLITFQRSYQASSRVITTTDQMTQDLIGLIR